MIVYLAGPITAVGRTAAMTWRERLRRKLEDVGISTFCPASAWLVAGEECAGIGSPIQFVDDAAIAVCDVMVVACTIHRSLGTNHETKLALSLNKPIVIYSFLPEALTESWARERGLHNAPIEHRQDTIARLLAEWKKNWRR